MLRLKKLKGDLTETRKVVTTTDTTPNYVAPKVDANGNAVTPVKPTGKTAEAAASGSTNATMDDSDGGWNT